MRTLLFLFLFAELLDAQAFTFGVKGGARFRDALDAGATSESRHYAIGPMVTARLPLGFRLEFDALYQRAGARVSFGTIHFFYIEHDHGNSWEFPVLVRRTVWRGIFGGAGFAPRRITGNAHVITYGFVPVQYSERDTPLEWRTTFGFVTAGGIERRLGRVRVAPEIRYTRWNQSPTDLFGGARNQVDVLVGVEF